MTTVFTTVLCLVLWQSIFAQLLGEVWGITCLNRCFLLPLSWYSFSQNSGTQSYIRERVEVFTLFHSKRWTYRLYQADPSESDDKCPHCTAQEQLTSSCTLQTVCIQSSHKVTRLEFHVCCTGWSGARHVLFPSMQVNETQKDNRRKEQKDVCSAGQTGSLTLFPPLSYTAHTFMLSSQPDCRNMKTH